MSVQILIEFNLISGSYDIPTISASNTGKLCNNSTPPCVLGTNTLDAVTPYFSAWFANIAKENPAKVSSEIPSFESINRLYVTNFVNLSPKSNCCVFNTFLTFDILVPISNIYVNTVANGNESEEDFIAR